MGININKTNISLNKINTFNNVSNKKIDNNYNNTTYEEINYSNPENSPSNQEEWEKVLAEILATFLPFGGLISLIVDLPYSNNDILNITSNSNFDKIVELKNGYRYCFNNDKLEMIKDDKDNVFRINNDGTITCASYLTTTLDIFYDLNNEHTQYGGNQMSFSYNNEYLLSRGDINNVINNYYPDATIEEKSLLLNKICNVGCGYTSVANAIFQRFIGKEKEFKETFGFDMYRLDSEGKVVYNYEPLILEIVLEYYKNEGNYSIEDLYGNVASNEFMAEIYDLFDVEQTGILDGVCPDRVKIIIELLNNKYKINLSFNANYYDPSILNKNSLQYFLDEGYTIIIGAGGYDLYDFDTGNLSIEDGGAHAMTLTGFTEDGKPIVSSWGKKYIIDVSNIGIENGGFFSLYFIK